MNKLIVLICFTTQFLITSCKHEGHKKEEESTFIVTSPIRKDTVTFNEYVCQIHAIQHIELRSLEKGYLQNIYVDEGQFVKKGTLMFKIMPLVYQAEAQTAQAEANYAEIEYLNTKALADSNIVSKNELALAKARLDKAKAELTLAQTHLGFTEIRAPFDGIMDHFFVRLGSLLDEGELLTTLSDNSKMWIYFNVPEAEYLNYISNKSNQATTVKLRMANGAEFDQAGKVETIEADFNNETGNIAFRATFENKKGILRHGETGDILMPVVLKNALIIPQKATFEVLDKKFVFVVDRNNIIRSQEIEIKSEMSHIYIVSDGLKEGDKILLEGLRKVKNGEKIKWKFVNQKQVLSELSNLHAE
ncbi:MAG TPA: efflux RND transporter periplasmic adaptor subunit [Bacteroidia bacterium]|nr:efflux RND transporter periplasmic adaptor subunit [Bacteroidia bacterium]